MSTETDDTISIPAPSTTVAAIVPRTEEAPAILNSKEEDEGDIETESDEEVTAKRILTVPPIPSIPTPIAPLAAAGSVEIETVSSAIPESVIPVLKEVTPSANLSISEAAIMAKEKEGRPIELPQPLFPTLQQAAIGASTSINPAGSSSSECSSESTLTDESDSDESDLENEPSTDREVGQKSTRPLTSTEKRVDSGPPIPSVPNIGGGNQGLELKTGLSESDKNDLESVTKKQKMESMTVKEEPTKNQIMKEEYKFPPPPNFPSHQSISPSPSLKRKTPINKSMPQIDVMSSPVNLLNAVKKVAKTEMKAPKEKKVSAAQRHSLGSSTSLPFKLEDKILGSSVASVGKVKNAAVSRKKKSVANSFQVNSANLPVFPVPGSTASASKAKKSANRTATSIVAEQGTLPAPVVAALTEANTAVKPKPASKKRR